MKKLVTFMLISLVITTFVFAQGSNEATTNGKKNVVLRMWGGVPPEAGPQAACDAFNELYKDKGIQVEYERFVNDATGNLKLETNLLAGPGIDLYVSYGQDSLSKRAEGNMALNLTPYMEKDNFDLVGYVGELATKNYINGNAYALPTKLDKYGLVLNKDMFDEAGIPIPTEWTFDEFREISKKLTHGEGADKVYGMFWNSQQDLTYILSYFVSQTNGGDYMYKNEKESNFTDPVVLAGVNLVNNMMNVDLSSPTHTDSVTQKLSQEGVFLAGKSAMTIGPWMVRSIKNLDSYPHDFVTAFAPYPVYSKEQRNYTQGGFGDLVSINPKSEYLDEAWTFLKWYATEGMLYVAQGGRVPAFNTMDPAAVTAAFLKGGEKLLDSETTMNVLIKPAANYAVTSITNHINEVKKVFIEEMENILINEKTPDEGMAAAQKRADLILAK